MHFEENKNELIKRLQEKAPSLSCPMCHSRHFTISPGFFLNFLQTNVGEIINLGGQSIPSFSLICNNCGFISQHAIGVLGLLEDKKDNEKNDSKEEKTVSSVNNSSPANFDVSDSLGKGLTVVSNVEDQCVVIITKDRLELELIRHKAIEKKSLNWATPLGLFATCITTLVTTDFKDFLIPKELWNGLFCVGTVSFLAWTIYTIVQRISNRKQIGINPLLNKLIKAKEFNSRLNYDLTRAEVLKNLNYPTAEQVYNSSHVRSVDH